MAEQTPPKGQVDEVQIFDVEQSLASQKGPAGRVDVATSPNSFIAVFRVPPRKGETHMHQHPDSDQILFILEGECTLEGLSSKYVVRKNQGVLIPAGVHYGFINATDKDLVFLSTRTESTGGRRVAYVPNVASDVCVKVPEEAFGAKGMGAFIFVYALDRRTLGLSPLLIEEWNRASLLRMNCEYERVDGFILAKLPLRVVHWYQAENLSDSDYTVIPEGDGTRVKIDFTPLIERETAGASVESAGSLTRG